jgi:replication-associated recombination protein RarA
MPEGLSTTQFYQPTNQGLEKRIAERLEMFKTIRDKLRNQQG